MGWMAPMRHLGAKMPVGQNQDVLGDSVFVENSKDPLSSAGFTTLLFVCVLMQGFALILGRARGLSRRGRAEEKAVALLKQWLSTAQLSQYETNGYFEVHATQITARPIESGDETELHRIATRREQYGKRSARPLRNAVMLGRELPGDLPLTNPITGIAGCCPRAASGHAATAPLRSVMNSRRFNRSPRRLVRAATAAQ